MAAHRDLINIDETLKRLNLDEKIELLSGSEHGKTRGLPEHGIPVLQVKH